MKPEVKMPRRKGGWSAGFWGLGLGRPSVMEDRTGRFYTDSKKIRKMGEFLLDAAEWMETYTKSKKKKRLK